MKTILIVENDVPQVLVLTRKFVNENFRVITAVDGQEGLELAIKEKPNVILTDIDMPIMDGLKMVERLREQRETNSIPVIVFSNKDLDHVNVQKVTMVQKSNITLDALIKLIKTQIK